MTEKCPVCGTEYELEDLIDWVAVYESLEEGDVWGQESECPECGNPRWINSDEIEEFLNESSFAKENSEERV